MLGLCRGLCVLTFLVAALSPGRAVGQPSDFLIIHSYHKGYAWTDEQSDGLEAGLRARFPDAILDTVYLDWKRYPTEQNLLDRETILRHRYEGRAAPVIATTDDAALSFALSLRASLFPNAPIIHGGVLQDKAKEIIGKETNVTGVFQAMDPLGTLQLAQMVSGPYRKALFIRDETKSSLEFEKQLRADAATLVPPVEITTLTGVPFGEILNRVHDIPKGEIVLLGSYTSDSKGTQFPLGSFVNRITQESSVPVYGFYTNQLGHGIVGGSLLSGTASGRLQARLIADVYEASSADSFPPLNRETTEKILDSAILDKWSLWSNGPWPDVEIEGPLPSVWKEHQTVVTVTVLIVLSLAALSGTLVVAILHRKAIQKTLEQNLVELHESQERTRKSEERYRLVAQATRDVVWEWDIKSDKRIFADQIHDLIGIPSERMDSYAKWADRIHPDDRGPILQFMDDFQAGTTNIYRTEYRMRHADGHYIWLESNALAIRDDDGKASLLVGRYTDITEAKKKQEELDHLAYHDTLTGLPNREHLRRHVGEIITSVPEARFALIFIDLDNFKLVNDSSGHEVGDEILKQATFRIQDLLGENRKVARLGGDEFVVVVKGGDLSILDEICEDITKTFRIPFTANNQKYYLGCSAGIAIFPTHGKSFESLLRNADTAMYDAKAKGKGAAIHYQEHMSETAINRINLHNRLRDAVEHGHFVVHYQPQVQTKDGRLRGAEALLRWQDPKHGLIPPDKFIPACEETGLIVDIGDWVLRSACDTLRRMDAQGFHKMHVSVNVSVAQLMQGDYVRKVAHIVDRANIDPRRLELEITESAVMSAFEDCRKRLKNLRDMGFQIGLDDFGVGYSSLTYLRRLPFSTLKLDKSFIRHLPEDPRDSAMVRSIIQIAHDLNLKTVAEGVEKHAQQTALAITPCTWLQGFMISKALPEEEFFAFTKTWAGFSEETKTKVSTA